MTATTTSTVRPLRRVGHGAWRSRDGRWTFLRHQSDPHPQRWYAYLDDDDQPANDGLGHVRLTDAAAWATDQPIPPTAPRAFTVVYYKHPPSCHVGRLDRVPRGRLADEVTYLWPYARTIVVLKAPPR